MPGVVGACIGVVVTHGEEVNIMKDKAVNLVKLKSFHEAYVEQLSAVESCCVCLLNNYNPGESKVI